MQAQACQADMSFPKRAAVKSSSITQFGDRMYHILDLTSKTMWLNLMSDRELIIFIWKSS